MPANARSEHPRLPSRAAQPPLQPLRAVCTDIRVVSEDEPGQWRVADRINDEVSGPFPDEASALSAAFDGVRSSSRWEIHVLDQFGTLLGSYNSDEDAMHVKVAVGPGSG